VNASAACHRVPVRFNQFPLVSRGCCRCRDVSSGSKCAGFQPGGSHSTSSLWRGWPFSACSVTDRVSQPECGHTQRRLCHTSRTSLNTGKSTNTTRRSPLHHNRPPQPEHGSLPACLRTCTPNGLPAPSATPSTSTSPDPTNNSHMRTGSRSTPILQVRGLTAPILEDPPPTPADTHNPYPPSLPKNHFLRRRPDGVAPAFKNGCYGFEAQLPGCPLLRTQ